MSEREHRDDNEDDILYIIYILSCTCQPKQNKKVSTKHDNEGAGVEDFAVGIRCGVVVIDPDLPGGVASAETHSPTRRGLGSFHKGHRIRYAAPRYWGGPRQISTAALRALWYRMPAAQLGL